MAGGWGWMKKIDSAQNRRFRKQLTVSTAPEAALINFSAVICSTRAPTNPVPPLCPRPSRFPRKSLFALCHSRRPPTKTELGSLPQKHSNVGKSQSRPESKTVEYERDLRTEE